ncbi:MAG: energy transducer TonB [Bacteroides stercoris]
MRILFITMLCVLLVGCANKSRQQTAGNAPISAKDSIYHLPDQYSEYPGGIGNLMKQIENSIQYPEEARKKGVEGRVIVQFIVDEGRGMYAATCVEERGAFFVIKRLYVLVRLLSANGNREHGRESP